MLLVETSLQVRVSWTSAGFVLFGVGEDALGLMSSRNPSQRVYFRREMFNNPREERRREAGRWA
jgi:hypothetical protein